MARRGTPYQGVLYAGLMVADGGPRLVEYNVRFGDPEAQVLAMRLGAQLLDACLACAAGELGQARVNFADDHALTVVMAARGYPGAYARGERIGCRASTTRGSRSSTPAPAPRTASWSRTAGGCSTPPPAPRASPRRARSPTPPSAGVAWPGGFYRRDIGWRALARAET